jgi:predicted nucleic acid-binding protein
VTLFVDTSAIIALFEVDEAAHARVGDAFARGRTEHLSTHAYVVVETLALARRRYGPAVAAEIIDRILTGITVKPVDAELHATALTAFRETVDSSVSFVDRTSFAFMRREGITRAIALDVDFRTAGFETLP